MIEKTEDVVLKVLPVLSTVEHLYYYEGPCRFGQGEELMPGHDKIANDQKIADFFSALEAALPAGMELMEPVHLSRTDNWENPEQQWIDAAGPAAEADVVVAMSGIACDDRLVEFAQRFHKPMILSPSAGFSASTVCAAVTARGASEVYACCQWADLTRILKTLRARKVVRTTRILCVSRFGSPLSYSSQDAFTSHAAITDKLGVQFRYANLHEVMDQMTPAVEGGNPTTPGRKTADLTEEDVALAERICDDLIEGARENTMTKENMMHSMIAYVTMRKQMELRDCNAFTMPCPDSCSTRRLNELKFTPCSIHALNMESGVASACEYDTAAVVSQRALMAVSGKRPYMGNTCPVPLENGKLSERFGTRPEQLERLASHPENLYMIQHSVAHRCLKDPNVKSPYGISHFAKDQKFGVTIRYDFDADAGQTITFCRFTPDGTKLFIGRGEIVMGGGYRDCNCTQLVYFRVKDQLDTWSKQILAGNHCSMVYGDYVRELEELACSLGVEPVTAV